MSTKLQSGRRLISLWRTSFGQFTCSDHF